MPTNVTPLSSDELITASVIMNQEELTVSDDWGSMLTHSCDVVRVFLTQPGFRAWMHSDNVQIHQNTPGGSAGAFIDCDRVPGYHIVINPRFNYPNDFVLRMVQHVERHRRRAIIGLGGGYRLSPSGFRGIPVTEAVPRDLPVHELDCSILAYHTHTAHFTRDIFGYGDIRLDTIFGAWAQRYEIPLIVAQHPTYWVTPIAGLEEPRSFNADGRYPNTIKIPTGAWHLFATKARNS